MSSRGGVLVVIPLTFGLVSRELTLAIRVGSARVFLAEPCGFPRVCVPDQRERSAGFN